MTLRDSGIALPAICLILSLAGCATNPAQEVTTAGDELRNTNMDVLFATEFPVASMEEALKVAGEALAAGDVDKAVFFYVRALQFDTGNVRLLTRIGDIHLRSGNTVMAKRAFLRAREHDPEFAPALEALGLIYMADGREEEAIGELSLALAADGQRWRAHNALGVYADRAGDHETAQMHYRTAMQLNPEAAHVLANIGYSRFLAGDADAAIADLYTAANDRGFTAAWGNLARVYASEGSYDEAVLAFGKVMSEARAYNATGKIAMQNGDLQAAYSLLSEAVGRSSTYFPEAEENLRKLKAGGVTALPLRIAGIRGTDTHE